MTDHSSDEGRFLSSVARRDDTVEQFRTLVDAVDDGVYRLDADGQFVAVDDTIVETTGYAREELLGEHVSMLLEDADAARLAAAIRLLIGSAEEDVSTLELTMRSADGKRLSCEFRFGLLTSDGEFRGTIGTVRVTGDARDQRRHQTIRRSYESVVSVIDGADVGVVVLDSDRHVAWINRTAERYFGLDWGDVVGRNERTLLGEIHGVVADPEGFEDAVLDDSGADASPERFECRVTAGEGREERWLERRSRPIESGRYAGGRVELYYDITERKRTERALRRSERRIQRQRELERYETIVETIPDGAYVIDEDHRFQLVNDAFCEMTGYDREELLGESIEVVSTGQGRERGEKLREKLRTGAIDVAVLEDRVETADGDAFDAEIRFDALSDEDGTFRGTAGVVRDVSERKEFERTLRTLNDTAREFLGATSREDVSEHVVETATEVLDLPCVVAYRYREDRDALVPQASTVNEEFPSQRFPELPADGSSLTGEVFHDGEARYEPEIGDPSRVRVNRSDTPMRSGLFMPVGSHGVVVAGSCDPDGIDDRQRQLLEILTANAEAACDRIEREQDLVESEERYRTLAENVPNGGVGMYDRDLRYTLVEGRMWDDIALDAEDLEGRTVSEALPPDTAEDVKPLFESALEGETDSVVSSLGGRTYRVWATPLRDARGEITAGLSIALDLTEQIERREELKRQRERLAALNELNSVVREIADAVIDQSTREEIERTVCEALADSDSYRFAWVGDVDRDESTVIPQVSAGVEEGYLEEIEIGTDEDDPTGRGPTGEAVRSREPQFWSNILEKPEYEPWHEAARERGYRSSAAIPIQHEGALYGVLNVYTERTGAFEDEERTVVAQLGEIVGHAIAAVKRKRALMSEDVIEVEFQVRDVFGSIDAPVTSEGRIAFEKTIPLGDGEYLQYGTATTGAIEAVEAVAEQRPHWEEVDLVREEDDEVRFGLRLSDPPTLSTIAALGGSVEEAVIEDGDYGLTVHLPRGEDLRRLVDAVREEYPDATVLAHRQASRRTSPSERAKESWVDELTDRQRRVLETAYFAGYFEWPRNSSGDEVAETLDISPPTFHEHLRAAENKLLGALLE